MKNVNCCHVSESGMEISAGNVNCCQTGRHKRDAFYTTANNQGDSLYPGSVCRECDAGKEHTDNNSMVWGMTTSMLGAA